MNPIALEVAILIEFFLVYPESQIMSCKAARFVSNVQYIGKRRIVTGGFTVHQSANHQAFRGGDNQFAVGVSKAELLSEVAIIGSNFADVVGATFRRAFLKLWRVFEERRSNRFLAGNFGDKDEFEFANVI